MHHAGVDIFVHVLTSGFWPTYPISEANLPEELNQYQQIFREFYLKKHSGRQLVWHNSLGTCILKVTAGARLLREAPCYVRLPMASATSCACPHVGSHTCTLIVYIQQRLWLMHASEFTIADAYLAWSQPPWWSTEMKISFSICTHGPEPVAYACAMGPQAADFLGRGNMVRFVDGGGGLFYLQAKFPRGGKELSVSLFQTVVLMLFNDADVLSFTDIKTASGIEDKELRRTLQSLACGKVNIAIWHPDVNVKETEAWKLYCVKWGQVQLFPSKGTAVGWLCQLPVHAAHKDCASILIHSVFRAACTSFALCTRVSFTQ